MEISTKLFNQLQVENFLNLQKEAQDVQQKIGSGKAILKASDDPVAAARLSAAKEQRNLLERFETNMDRAQSRLSLSEKVLQEGVNILTRIGELTIQAANATYGAADREVLLSELDAMYNAFLEVANSRDAQGLALFAGYRSGELPFVKNEEGRIDYRGDAGQARVQISENMVVETGVDGISLFGQVKTENGVRSIFNIIEGALQNIDPRQSEVSGVVESVNAAIDHLSGKMAILGTQINKIDTHREVVAQRKIAITEQISNLGDADIAALVTRLQSLLLNQQAAQSAFAKIGEQNLFDYLR